MLLAAAEPVFVAWGYHWASLTFGTISVGIINAFVLVASGLHVQTVGPADGAESKWSGAAIAGIRLTLFTRNAQGPITRVMR